MDKAIKHHLDQSITTREKLTGGFMFQTWLLTLSNNQKVIFRHQKDLETGSGGTLIIADILEREKFFYDTTNKSTGNICPKVYVVDGTRQHHENAFCIMEYIEGTPLQQCINDFDEKTKNDVMYKIGEIAAQFNSIEIDSNHPYVIGRTSFENLIADRLWDVFVPLVNSKVITQPEADKIVADMRSKKASRTLSFLHLDMRHCNMIYNNGSIFVVDAANCQFGDPLWELAVIDVGGELTPPLIEGYKNTFSGNIDLNDELYYYYKMDRMAVVLHLFLNQVKTDAAATQKYLALFNDLKQRLLR